MSFTDKSAILTLSQDNAASPAKPAPTASGPQWRPTRALRRTAIIIAVALLISVSLGRPDFVAIAAPFVLGTALALTHRPRQAPTAVLTRDDDDPITEGGQITARITVHNPESAAMVSVVSATAGRWIRLSHGVGRYVDALPGGTAIEVGLHGTALRWGHHSIGPAAVHALACDGLLVSRQQILPALHERVYPSVDVFDSSQGLPKAAGMAGIHHSRRLGEGGELAEVRQFQAGDRLRRIDWRVSLRHQQLYVNATLSERDADVVLVLDVLHEAGPQPGSASILDTTVRAAAAIVEHYAHQGDRVAIIEFGPQMRRLRFGTGRRHFTAAREWLVDTRVLPGGLTSVDRLVSSGAIPSHAMVIMLTPLIDENSTAGLARLARSGRAMIAVDTLPPNLFPPARGEWTPSAYRLWQLERSNTLGRLRELGVPVQTWGGAGSLDAMIAEVARLGRVPRAASR